jgi:hypothetical protein
MKPTTGKGWLLFSAGSCGHDYIRKVWADSYEEAIKWLDKHVTYKKPCGQCMVEMTRLNNEISAQLDSQMQELSPQDQA